MPKIKPKTHNTFSINKILNKDFIVDLVSNPRHLNITCWVLLGLELFLNLYIIRNVKYTEIDWVAYMQEVEGFINGTLDYKLLKGDTGPLVYPSGFVYIYTAFYYITSHGANIQLAQYIFLIIYLAQMYFVFRLYIKTQKLPPYALIFTTLTSYRIHSIYVLRLFNDPIAILLLFISLNLYLDNRWLAGSIFYSLAVSVKMNVLLYAPCLLTLFLTNLNFVQTGINLMVCALVQLVLGAPFLIHNFVSYIQGSFDLSRIFEHKWTVNYRFLPREIFEHRSFHVALLVLHLTLLGLFLPAIKKYLSSYAKLNCVKTDLVSKKRRKAQPQLDETKSINFDRTAQLFVLPFFITNFIGVTCARSLHYQFYVWYFHSLIYLVFCTKYRKMLMFCLLGVIEMCWNTYPSTNFSSVLLHVCHGVLLVGLYKYTN